MLFAWFLQSVLIKSQVLEDVVVNPASQLVFRQRLYVFVKHHTLFFTFNEHERGKRVFLKINSVKLLHSGDGVNIGGLILGRGGKEEHSVLFEFQGPRKPLVNPLKMFNSFVVVI